MEERIAILERKVAILMGELDPGLPCPVRDCHGGYVDVNENIRDVTWQRCKVCEGRQRIYPPLKKE